MKLVSLLVTAVSSLGFGVAPTLAATYEVTACASHPLAAAGAFEQLNTSPATLETTTACRGTPIGEFEGIVAADRPGNLGTPSGRVAASTITAASGTSIRAIRARRYLGKRDNEWHVWVRTGEGTILESCEVNASFSCTVGAEPTSQSSWTTYSGLATDSVSFGVSCRAAVGDCVSASSFRSAWAIVYSTVTTVDDPAPPTSVVVSGPLADGSHNWLSGDMAARLAAEDASGIRRIDLISDGVTVGSVEGACDFGLMRPCPGRLEEHLLVETTRLGDGEHRLTARAVDAAGNATESTATVVRVDTSAPEAPLELRALPGAGGSYRVSWRNPEQGAAAAIAAAHYQLCMVRSNDCVSGGVVPGTAITALPDLQPPPGRSPWDLLVWLQDGAGHAERSRAARITLLPQTSSPPPDPGPGGPRPPAPQPTDPRRSAPGLRVTSAVRTRHAIVVRGTLKKGVAGRVVISLRRRPASRAWASRSVVPRRGRFTVQFTNRRALRSRRTYVTARFLATRSVTSQMVTRLVRRDLRG
jgi:hypothetical protein